ncbi:MAG: N-acetylornithine carbamoyltransferase [Candidatus Hodarchaeota archaeon]
MKPSKQVIKGSDFITTQEWEKEKLEFLIDKAFELKNTKDPSKYSEILKNKTLIMLFFNPSTRTRTSFEVAMTQLGGHAIFMSGKDIWLGKNSESVKDTAKVFSRYADIIAIRMFPDISKGDYGTINKIMREFAEWSEIPIINMEDDLFHPCQALTDIMTIKEKLGSLKNKKIVISWAYHPKPLPVSVPNSIVLNSTRFGLDVTLCHPKGFELQPYILKTAEQNAKDNGGSFRIVNTMEEGYKDAEIVYVKSWGALQYYGNNKEEKQLRQPYRGKWICNEKIMKITAKSSIFMHCLPVLRNVVVDDVVIDGSHSVVYEQAENRLHLQKALLSEIG